MICEATRQAHIRDHGPTGGFTWVLGRKITVTYTAQPLGGQRAWFLCPECDRRCAILYPLSCRKCLGLHYATEHLSPYDRMLTKAIRARARLGQAKGGVCVPFPAKPKLMRWHTYLKARREAQRNEALIAGSLRTSLCRLRKG